jgi:hypothetical protein
LLVYWSLFLAPGLAALFERERRGKGGKPTFALLLFLVFLIVAFRETGGDYERYLLMSDLISPLGFSEAIELTDPAYGALNWGSNQLGLGLYGVNTVCALIFLFGFARFCAPESRSLLMLAVAASYLIIVVVIGYTRQGTAIGLEFFALRALMERRFFPSVAWILIAAGFHRSAAVLLPLAYFAAPAHTSKMRKITAGIAVIATVVIVAAQLSTQADTYIANYLQSSRYESQGAIIRSLMSFAAGVVFLLYRRRWAAIWGDHDIWLVFSVAALALTGLSVIASTAADRMGLYVIPLQIIVFARLPSLAPSARRKNEFVMGAIAIYAIALGVWLHLGQFAGQLWLPYRSLLFGTVP